MKDHNKDLKNQLADMKESLEALQIHNERVYRAEVSRLEAELADLNQKKDAAIEVGDVEEVKNIDKKIDSVKTTIAEPVVKPQKSTSNPAYDAWIKDNKWYIEEPEMAAYADQVAQQYIGAPADRVYTAVRNKVAELWPDKFNTAVNSVNPKSTVTKPIVAPNPVEGGHKQPTSGKFTKVDLTDSQRSMMTQFAKMGIMTEAQYISDIAKLQGEKIMIEKETTSQPEKPLEQVRKRIPLGSRNILTAPKRPGFVRRFVNDKGDRITAFKDAGWNPVENTPVGDPKLVVLHQSVV